ncbi:MAG: hypothetical protein IBX63_10150 [Coriobacteriia bacterium]|nr:hypothetical protein [Coriobacteriia bacterium]
MAHPKKYPAKPPEKHALSGDRDAQGRWRPGASGNPAGRPPGVSLRPLIEARLSDTPEGLEGRTLGEELAMRIVADAIKRDGPSRKLVFELLEGKARQSVAITQPDAPVKEVSDEQHRAYAEAAVRVVREAEKAAQAADD